MVELVQETQEEKEAVLNYLLHCCCPQGCGYEFEQGSDGVYRCPECGTPKGE